MTAIFFTSVGIYSKKNNRRNVNPRWQNKNVKMSTRNDLRPYNFYHLYRDHDVPNRYQSFTLMLVHANYYRLYSTKKLSSLSLSLSPIKTTKHKDWTSYLDEIERFRQHYDATSLLLPDHPPKFRHGILHGSLSHDVSVRFQYTLKFK